MTQKILANDQRLTWAGAISLEHGQGWTAPWRLNHLDQSLLPQGLRERAAQSAGVRLVFQSDTTSLGGQMQPSETAERVDVTINGHLHAGADINTQGRFEFSVLPPGEKQLELWLPQYRVVKMSHLDLSAGASLKQAAADTRPRWVTYGSSITHCRAAESPVHTWPAIVAREHGLNLTCLGYGGNCHLDPLVALTMRDQPADFISICAGVNIQGGGSLSKRTFGSMLIGFIRIVREKHPNTPLVAISPTFCAKDDRETTPNAVGMTMQNMREEVHAAVTTLQALGDQNLHYVSGLELFGPELAEHMPDGLHPNAQGYKLLAQNYLKKIAQVHFKH